jgi:hypothetical protein
LTVYGTVNRDVSKHPCEMAGLPTESSSLSATSRAMRRWDLLV